MHQTIIKDLLRVSFDYQREYMSEYIKDNNRYGSQVLEIDGGGNLGLFPKGYSRHPMAIRMSKGITHDLQMVYYSSN